MRANPLFVALVVIELTEILFALDSIPGYFWPLPQTPLLFFTSNIFAIPSLRSMYFLISRMLQEFRFNQL